MQLCVVTDRRRTDVVAQARRAVDAGVDLIQIRERDMEARDLAGLVERVLRIARGSATRVVVNDRLDVALACGADGVHLRGDSIPVEAARTIAPRPFLIGRSVHSVDEARAAAGADYLIAGTVFPSASKPTATTWLGLAGLEQIVRAARPPVLAIGGIDLDRAAEIGGTGAAGIAAIALFATESLGAVAAAARRRFDSLKPRP